MVLSKAGRWFLYFSPIGFSQTRLDGGFYHFLLLALHRPGWSAIYYYFWLKYKNGSSPLLYTNKMFLTKRFVLFHALGCRFTSCALYRPGNYALSWCLLHWCSNVFRFCVCDECFPWASARTPTENRDRSCWVATNIKWFCSLVRQ